MKGVMNKLSFSLGKKKREAQKNSTETSEQPSTVPDEHQPDTDRGFFDDSQNIGPNTSRVIEYETSTEVLEEGACSSLEIPEETLIQTSQSEKFKLYKDPVESKINKDSTPQEIPYAISDSDRITGDGKRYRDGTKTDRYVFGLDEDIRDSERVRNKDHQLYKRNATDAAYCLPGERETLISEVPQIFLRDRHDDDGIVGTSDFHPIGKEIHYPIERAEKEYAEMPAPIFKEFRERDKNLTFDVNPPQLIHYSPEDPRIIRSHFKSEPESDIKSADYLYAKSDRMSQIPAQDSGNYIGGSYFNPRLKEEEFSVCNPREKGHLQSERDLADRLYKKSDKKRSIGFIDDSYPYRPNDKDITLKYDDGLEKDQIKPDTMDLQKDNGGFDNYAEASYYTYRSSGDKGNINTQYKQSSLMYDPHQRYISDGKTFDPDCQIDVDSCRRVYHSNTASGSHPKGEKLDKQRREEAFDKQGSDPDEISMDDFIEKTVVTKKMKERSRLIFIDPKRPNPVNTSQNPAVNSNIKSEDKDDSYSKRDTNVNPAYKTRNLKTFKDRALNQAKRNDDTFGRHLSLFGRWMVTHGHLVDPYDFCLWSYASCPEEYIDLSKYQMDLRGRWLDASGCSVTPFFYCYSYDGEPIYLGDCDCYDVFKNSYDVTTNDSTKFANNPERFIDLSDFQMDMEERWRDCDGRYVDPFSEWYAIGSPENEISEYDWLYNRPETLALSPYPRTMYDYFEDYLDINPFLPKSNVMVTDIPDLEDYLFTENFIFWGYPTRCPSNIPGLSDDPSNRADLWPDTEHFRDVSKGRKAVGDGNRSDSYDHMKYRSKKKTK